MAIRKKGEIWPAGKRTRATLRLAFASPVNHWSHVSRDRGQDLKSTCEAAAMLRHWIAPDSNAMMRGDRFVIARSGKARTRWWWQAAAKSGVQPLGSPQVVFQQAAVSDR